MNQHAMDCDIDYRKPALRQSLRPDFRCVLAALALLIALSTPAKAQDVPMNKSEAHALVKRYIELHNEHRLDAVMALYGDDATFQLNAGRGLVKGKYEIRELEMFDIYAGSRLQPYGLEFEREGDSWLVHIAGVIEHSRIFSALGMKIVRTGSIRSGFVLRGGTIVTVRQPDFNPACTRIAMAGFTGLAEWLRETGNHHSKELISNGKLVFKPENIPSIILALDDWRSATGWRPEASELLTCAAPNVGF